MKDSAQAYIEYRGYIISPNLTGYVNYHFHLKDNAERVDGDGKTIDECKSKIDETLNE